MPEGKVCLSEKSDAYVRGMGIHTQKVRMPCRRVRYAILKSQDTMPEGKVCLSEKSDAYVKGLGIAVEKVECLYRRVRYRDVNVDMPILN